MSRVLPYNAKQWEIPLLLDERKTVTRRCIKPQPIYNTNSGFNWKGYAYGTDLPQTLKGAAYNFQCAAPYQPGDVLYVKEIWGYDVGGIYIYKASYKECFTGNKATDTVGNEIRWNSSIHMPKEAARILLKVLSVRVERLRDITEEQAKAEGFSCRNEFIKTFLKMYPDCKEESWLWVIEFERCKKPEGEL